MLINLAAHQISDTPPSTLSAYLIDSLLHSGNISHRLTQWWLLCEIYYSRHFSHDQDIGVQDQDIGVHDQDTKNAPRDCLKTKTYLESSRPCCKDDTDSGDVWWRRLIDTLATHGTYECVSTSLHAVVTMESLLIYLANFPWCSIGLTTACEKVVTYL